jgi:predicted N-formylglutamate amidohydrolase
MLLPTIAGLDAPVDSHRGWAPGLFRLGRQLADAYSAPWHASNAMRLLIDLNRLIGHRQLFSEITRVLLRAERERTGANTADRTATATATRVTI